MDVAQPQYLSRYFCSSVFSNCTENVNKITLKAKIADIESEEVVFPTSVGESTNLVVFRFIDFFLQITIIATLELLLTSCLDAKFMCSVYP